MQPLRYLVAAMMKEVAGKLGTQFGMPIVIVYGIYAELSSFFLPCSILPKAMKSMFHDF